MSTLHNEQIRNEIQCSLYSWYYAEAHCKQHCGLASTQHSFELQRNFTMCAEPIKQWANWAVVPGPALWKAPRIY